MVQHLEREDFERQLTGEVPRVRDAEEAKILLERKYAAIKHVHSESDQVKRQG